MSSVSSTRHLEDDAETTDNDFIFDASIIPQNSVKSCPDTVSTSECLSNPIQPNKSLDRACLELFGSHDACMMEADKSTWHDNVMSWTDYKNIHKGSYDDYEMYLFIYHPFMRDRAKRLVKLADWQRHNDSDLTIIVRPLVKSKHTRWIAFDIDIPISELELVTALQQAEQRHNVSFTYCASTSGRSYHIWLFTEQAKNLVKMHDAALVLADSLQIEIDQLYPNGAMQITAPFAKHRPLKTTAGKVITHPAYLPFNDAAIDSLNKADIEAPKTRQNGTQANTTNKKHHKRTDGMSWLDDIPKSIKIALRNAFMKSREAYLLAVRKHYPASSGYRQSYVLAVAADLVTLGFSKAKAIELINDIASCKNDTEIAQRSVAIKSTFAKAKTGAKILGFADISTEENVRKHYFYSNVNEYAKNLRPLIVEQRLVTVIHLRMSATNILYTAGRPLADNTGTTEGTVRAGLKSLQKKGIVAVLKTSKGTQIKLLKGFEAYLIETETQKEAAPQNVKRVAENKERHKKETQKHHTHNTVTALPRNNPDNTVTDTKKGLSRGDGVTQTDKGIAKQVTQAMIDEKVARSKANRKGKKRIKTVTVTQLGNDYG